MLSSGIVIFDYIGSACIPFSSRASGRPERDAVSQVCLANQRFQTFLAASSFTFKSVDISGKVVDACLQSDSELLLVFSPLPS